MRAGEYVWPRRSPTDSASYRTQRLLTRRSRDAVKENDIAIQWNLLLKAQIFFGILLRR